MKNESTTRNVTPRSKMEFYENATQNIVSCANVLHFSENSKTWHTFSGNRVPKCAIFIREDHKPTNFVGGKDRCALLRMLNFEC